MDPKISLNSNLKTTGKKVEKIIKIGPPKLTRFERARIVGARSLQIALGAPLFIQLPKELKNSIELAIIELKRKALPISIRRTLPNGIYQDIPLDWLSEEE
ncbi:MAG: DNA-directed RNA polymerase subunit K [Nitrososphaerales archaeon]